MDIETEILNKSLEYSTEPKSIEDNTRLYFYFKKYILLKPLGERISNINDELILDGYIEGNKEELDWNNFLISLSMDYTFDNFREQVLERFQSRERMPTYSEIFAMKAYYDKLFAKTIKIKYLPKNKDYIYSSIFLNYCSGFCIYSQNDFNAVLSNYLNIPYPKLVSSMQKMNIPRPEALGTILRLANKTTKNTIFEYHKKYIIDDDEKGNWILVEVY